MCIYIKQKREKTVELVQLGPKVKQLYGGFLVTAMSYSSLQVIHDCTSPKKLDKVYSSV